MKFFIIGLRLITSLTQAAETEIGVLHGSPNKKGADSDVTTLKQVYYLFGPAQLAHQAKCLSDEPCVLFISFDQPIGAEAYKEKL